MMPVSWIPGGAQRAAYLAALGLVAIQVGIGIVLKIAQTGGTYSFSPSASVTISEFFKMLLSSMFFYRECKQRAASGIQPSTRGGGAGYNLVGGSDSLPVAERKDEHEKDSDEANGSNGSASSSERIMAPARPLDMRTYWSYFRGEVTVDVRYGFCNLAMFYVLINNSIFVSYKMADPGTIQLTKSGVTFITALVMIIALGSKISRIQWIAIIIQICGLMVTQYNPETGTTYPLSTYLILFFQVFLSASSGVYNQALLKSDDSSLHADNMILYAAGSASNLLVHIVVRTLKSDEPGFFTGYNSFGAIMVIVSNVFIGLAITAVYKYADAVIKCFATAFATGILLYVSPILFGTELSFLVLPGTVVVFIASWLYMDNPAPKTPGAPAETGKKSMFTKLADYMKRHNKLVLVCSTVFTVVVVAFLTMFEAKMPDLGKSKLGTRPPPSAPLVADPNAAKEPSFRHNHSKGLECMDGDELQSPFKDTMAMIRWNSPHPERVPKLMKYAPFFNTIHISLPDSLPGQPLDYHNLTYDQWPADGTHIIYRQIAHTMQLVLDEQPDIKGLLYFHFDAWVNPLAWAGADPNTIWFPSILDIAPPNHGGPEFKCMTDKSRYWWWGWDHGFHYGAMAAQNAIEKMGLPFTVNPKEWCSGWSDIYYIPRRFFADYILLADMFGRFDVFHEVAVPTMIHIIDQSRRSNKFRSVLDLFGDCWGSCCASDPTAEDVIFNRCGHRLDYRQEDITNAFYDHLDEEARSLGQNQNCTLSAADGAMSKQTAEEKEIVKAVNAAKKEIEQTKKDDERIAKEKQAQEEKEKKEKEAQENNGK